MKKWLQKTVLVAMLTAVPTLSLNLNEVHAKIDCERALKMKDPRGKILPHDELVTLGGILLRVWLTVYSGQVLHMPGSTQICIPETQGLQAPPILDYEQLVIEFDAKGPQKPLDYWPFPCLPTIVHIRHEAVELEVIDFDKSDVVLNEVLRIIETGDMSKYVFSFPDMQRMRRHYHPTFAPWEALDNDWLLNKRLCAMQARGILASRPTVARQNGKYIVRLKYDTKTQ